VRTLRSDGENEARAYVEVDVPPSRVEPTIETERVAVSDPRRTPTLRLDERPRGSGPRNPAQTTLPGPEELRAELPEGLPLTKAQLVIVPPELAAKWRAEAKNGAANERGKNKSGP
jgi:hypothetical protein